MKQAEALTNKGGGKAGQQDRLGGKAGHAKYQCHVCKTQAPSLTSMEAHFTARHPSLPWEPEKCTNTHDEVGGVTVAGVAVRGSKKK